MCKFYSLLLRHLTDFRVCSRAKIVAGCEYHGVKVEDVESKIRKNIETNTDYQNRYQFEGIKNRAMGLKSSMDFEAAEVNAAMRRVFSIVVVDWEKNILELR